MCTKPKINVFLFGTNVFLYEIAKLFKIRVIITQIIRYVSILTHAEKWDPNSIELHDLNCLIKIILPICWLYKNDKKCKFKNKLFDL
jgi:hypothetical protein